MTDDAAFKEVQQIRSWISKGIVWTKNPKKTKAEPTPGIYGKNIVTSYTTINDINYVLSEYIDGQKDLGYREAVKFSDWIEYMMKA